MGLNENQPLKKRSNRGRPKMIKSPEIMWDLFEQYVQWAKENPITIEDYVGKDAIRVLREKPRAISVEGFMNFVSRIPGMPVGLEEYFSNYQGRYSEFVAICSRIKREVRDHQIAGALAGVYNPSVTQRLNGLVEKTEQKVTVEQPLFNDTPADHRLTSGSEPKLLSGE